MDYNSKEYRLNMLIETRDVMIDGLKIRCEELQSEINSVKAMHNGYDPECRASMPTLKEPGSLKEAVEELIDEARGMRDTEKHLLKEKP